MLHLRRSCHESCNVCALCYVSKPHQTMSIWPELVLKPPPSMMALQPWSLVVYLMCSLNIHYIVIHLQSPYIHVQHFVPERTAWHGMKDNAAGTKGQPALQQPRIIFADMLQPLGIYYITDSM